MTKYQDEWRDKMLAAATKAANESQQNERARCLWVLDSIIVELERELSKKLLMESERHLVQVKLRIARSIVGRATRAIVSGVTPVRGALGKEPPPQAGPTEMVT